ncbi:MAG: RNA polymerase sigma factor [Candidatus Dormibacterales bacterium]
MPGNRDDFDRLYRASHSTIVRTLNVMLGDWAAAEDCCQDAFERAFRKWSLWRPDAPAEAWVRRIAVNAAITHRRRMRLRTVGEVILRLGLPAPAPDPQDLVERHRVTESLAKLPVKLASAIVLRHFHGYTNRAIAQSAGVPERTIASRIANAKQRLRATLTDRIEPNRCAVGTCGEHDVI